MPRIIDLFAGLGWIRLGFQQAMDELGLETECVFSSEIKPYAIKAYNGFYGDEEIYGDITLVNTNQDIPDFDYLLAGFPCQPSCRMICIYFILKYSFNFKKQRPSCICKSISISRREIGRAHV